MELINLKTGVLVLCSNLNCTIYLLWDFLWEGVLVRLVGPKIIFDNSDKA